VIKYYVGDSVHVLKNVEPGSIQCCIADVPTFMSAKHGIGSESDYTEYAKNVLSVLQRVWHTLSKNGTLWLKVTDVYITQGLDASVSQSSCMLISQDDKYFYPKVPPECLLLFPQRLLLKLLEYGYRPLSNIILNEVIRQQPSKKHPKISHSYLFMLARGMFNYYDRAAVPEYHQKSHWDFMTTSGGSLWGSVISEKLVETCIRMSVNPDGVCRFCGKQKPCSHNTLRKPATLLDPFCGPGVSLFVAERLGLNAIGVEINPKMVKDFKERYENIFGAWHPEVVHYGD